MKKKLLFSLFLLLPAILSANIFLSYSDSLKKENWNINIGGLIATDFFWDSRQMIGSRDGAITLYPDNIMYDHHGKDINAHPSFNFVAMNSRLSVRIQAPTVLKANISAMIEGWFMGVSNVDMNAFALRHAFIKMDWKTTSLLLGQTWHPLFTEHCFAQTIAASSGAPFQPFSRAPQIRIVQKFGKLSSIMLYFNAQRDFLSVGNEGASSAYLRRSAIPEMGMQYHFTYKNKIDDFLKDELSWGMGINYKYLIPRIVTQAGNYTSQGFSNFAATFFLHYRHDHTSNFYWGFKIKSVFSQACNEYLMLGGYAIKKYDNAPLNDSIDYSYTPLNTLSSWLDFYFNYKSWEFGLFLGNAYNIGAFQQVQDYKNPQSYFGRGTDIHTLYRISCRVKYTVKMLQFGVEPEYTLAHYAKNFNAYGKPENFDATPFKNIGGLRALFSVTLFF